MTPDSSRTSRRTASSTDSPASTNPIGTEVKQFIPANTPIQNMGDSLPAKQEYCRFGQTVCLPSNILSSVGCMTQTMMTGSILVICQ